MNHRVFAASLAGAMLLSAAAFAQVEGNYAMTGVSTDKSTYAGTVEVTKAGPGFQIVWTIEGTRTFGAGMMEGGSLVVGSVDEGRAIVQVMKPDGRNLKGAWFRRTESALGEETWIRL